MAKLRFKVYLNEDSWTCTEVRRFGIDADVATNFMYLHEKLQTIFPDLRGKSFIITWKDREKETITISTNEELEVALDEMAKCDEIYKLYVMLQPERDAMDIQKIEKMSHPGVVCDICDKGIRGFRFKCMQCPDYDLCMDCMTLGNHLEHYMVRMTQPIEWSSHHGRRLAHHVRKFMKKASQHYKEDERRCLHRSSRRGGCSTGDGKFDFFDPSVVNSLANFVMDIRAAAPDENHEQKRFKEQHAERKPSAETATEATEDPQQEATRHTFSQMLKIVEDNISHIAQFLDPLGINVTVMAENDPAKNKPDNAQTKTGTQKPETRASTSSEDSAKKFPGEGKKLRDEAVSTAAASSTDNAPSAQKNSAATTTTTAAEQAAEAEEWTMIQRDSPTISRTSSSASSLNGTALKQPTPSAPTAPAAEPEKTVPSNQRIYPPLPEEVTNESYHPNPKIQRAVEAMIAMGFSNEGSWLTHLLVAQNGDIDKALDVIHPVRRH